jgi:hypothetical protein
MTEPAAPEPLVWLDGQPTTATEAGARRQELMQDPDYGKAAAAGDMTKIAELTKLWRIEHGMTPEPVAPATSEQVRAQMQDADRILEDARVETWGQSISGFTDVMRAQVARNLATQEQHDQAVLEVRRMLSDREFGRRVLDGDMDAKDRWARFNLIAAMQVAPADYDWNNDLARFVPARSRIIAGERSK